MKPKISFSVSDIPLGVSINKQFQLAKDLNIDGVEVVVGYKTGITVKKIDKLSRAYNVKILSVHEAPWSFLKLSRDRLGFRIAEHFGAKYIAHPSFSDYLYSKKTLRFLEWLWKMGEKHKVEVLLENLSRSCTYRILQPFLKRHFSITHPIHLKEICSYFNFGMTLDTSHLNHISPHTEEWFEEIHPFIKNIHLSDFAKRQHLPLGEGIFEFSSFLNYLKEKKYSELITLELPVRFLYSRRKFAKDIKSSIRLIKRHIVN